MGGLSKLCIEYEESTQKKEKRKKKKEKEKGINWHSCTTQFLFIQLYTTLYFFAYTYKSASEFNSLPYLVLPTVFI